MDSENRRQLVTMTGTFWGEYGRNLNQVGAGRHWHLHLTGRSNVMVMIRFRAPYLPVSRCKA
jgi:hypothetical protein